MLSFLRRPPLYPACTSWATVPSPDAVVQCRTGGPQALYPTVVVASLCPSPSSDGPQGCAHSASGSQAGSVAQVGCLVPLAALTPSGQHSEGALPLPAGSALPSCSHSPAWSTQVAHAGAHTCTHRPRLAPTEQSRLTPSIQLRSGSSAWTPPGLPLWVPTPPGPGREQASASVQGTSWRLWRRVLMAVGCSDSATREGPEAVVGRG